MRVLSNAEKQLLVKKYKEKIIDGVALAKTIRSALKQRIIDINLRYKNDNHMRPWLGHIIVGDLPASETYVRLKLKACDEIGIGHYGFRLAHDANQNDLLLKVKEL